MTFSGQYPKIKSGHHPNWFKYGLDPKCNMQQNVLLDILPKVDIIKTCVNMDLIQNAKFTNWLWVKYFAGHSPKSGQHPKWFKNGFDPRCNIYKCTCSKILCWTFSKKVDIIQTGLNRDLDNPHWVQMHLRKSHGLLLGLLCLLLGQSSSFSAILFQMLPRLTPWHSGLGWKVSDSKQKKFFWDKWSRTFLHIPRNQPRPYLVVFWTHVLRNSGTVWRGRKKIPLLGHFWLNL